LQPNEEEYNNRLEDIKSRDYGKYSKEKVKEELDYVAARFEEEHLCTFLTLNLAPPFIRYGQLANGVAEGFWNMIESQRKLPICDAILSILKYDMERRCEFAREADERVHACDGTAGTARLLLTPSVATETEKLLGSTQKWQVSVTVCKDEAGRDCLLRP
jgi:hypothetical protein